MKLFVMTSMSATLGAAADDVLWSIGFLLRYSWLILPVCMVPAVQRIVAALHPDVPVLFSWPSEAVVGVFRLALVAGVSWLGWHADRPLRRPGVDSAGAILAAVVDYIREGWVRLLLAAAIAAVLFVALNLLIGPALAAVLGSAGAGERAVSAWTFGARNLVIIPLFAVVVYGLVRPAFLGVNG